MLYSLIKVVAFSSMPQCSDEAENLSAIVVPVLNRRRR